MAGINVPMNQSTGRRISGAAVSAPRLVMSWEDWLTFGAAVIAFMSVAISIQQAHWVRNMPALVPTALAGLLIGMIAARIKLNAALLHPVAIALGVVVVALVVQSYADGATIAERLGDFRARMREWFDVVVAGDISNDNLPFVTLVHSLCFLCAYLASWSIYRWRNPWLAVIPGGMVLLANVSFLKGQPSTAVIFFLFGAVLLIARLHLQRSQLRWVRQKVEYPEFISLSAIQLTLVLTSVLIIGAWMLPIGSQTAAAESTLNILVKPVTGQSDTLVRLFHNVDSHKGGNLHTFGDILAIQGNVSLGTRPVYEIKSPEPGLVRAQSYEEYTGAGWKTTGRDSTRVDAKDVALPADATPYEKRVQSILNVTVLDSGTTVLTQGTAVGTNLPTTVEGPRGVAGEIERVQSRQTLKNGDSYNSIGSVSVATGEDLEGAGAEYPAWVTDRYLQLPKSLPQRVRDEAQRVAASGTTPFDQAKAIESYLRAFPYNLTVESPPAGADTVDYFLFTLKAGYFDYQASAMAVMLRTLGIPARVTVGYALDPSSDVDTKYTVRKDDAYSWVEVFFPKYGWVNFNPTSDRASGIGLASTGDASTVTGSLDPSSLGELFPLDGFENLPPDSPGSAALKQDPRVQGEPPWVLIWSLAGVLTLVVAAFIAGRVSWNYGLSGIDGRPRMWAKVQRVAGWAGLGAKPAETPREWSRRLGDALEREDDARSLADAYEEARYGRPDLQRVDDSVVEGSYRNLRNTLLHRVFRRGAGNRDRGTGNRRS